MADVPSQNGRKNMIDITTSEPIVIGTRQTMHKNFDIDVTTGHGTDNLEIDIVHIEDNDGGNTELAHIKVGKSRFEAGVGLDVGLNLHECLGSWFSHAFYELTEEDTKEDFENIFSAVWEYIEEKDLW